MIKSIEEILDKLSLPRAPRYIDLLKEWGDSIVDECADKAHLYKINYTFSNKGTCIVDKDSIFNVKEDIIPCHGL